MEPISWTGTNGYKLSHKKLHLNMRKSFFTLRVLQHWKRVPREVVESSLQIFKIHQNVFLCDLLQVTLPCQGVWTGWSPEVPCNDSVILPAEDILWCRDYEFCDIAKILVLIECLLFHIGSFIKFGVFYQPIETFFLWKKLLRLHFMKDTIWICRWTVSDIKKELATLDIVWRY